MASAEFLKAEGPVLVYEGGKVDNPKDPGGRTNQGVTQTTYNAYRRSKGLGTQNNFYPMPNTERDDIYETEYWDRIAGDQLPVGLGFCVFDAAVNSGVGQAGKWLQAALGSSYAGYADGIVGSKTIQAIQDHGDVDGLIEEFRSRRLGTLKRLKTWPTFGKGWAARISNCQKIALAWADASGSTPVAHPVDVTTEGGHQKAHVVDNIKEPAISQITAHVTTAAGSVATVAAQSAQQLQPLSDTFSWMKYVFGVLTLLGVAAGVAVKVSTAANKAATDGTAHATVDPDADAGYAPVVAAAGA